MFVCVIATNIIIFVLYFKIHVIQSGDSLDKSIDMGAIVDPSQRKSVDEFVQKAKEEGAQVFQSCACMPKKGCFYPPTLITNVQPVSTIVQEEVGVVN